VAGQWQSGERAGAGADVFIRLAGGLPLQNPLAGQAAAELNHDLRLRQLAQKKVAEWAQTLGWPLIGDVLSQTGQPLPCADLWLATSQYSSGSQVACHCRTRLPVRLLPS
jgi:hypothetical protein